MGVRNWAEHWVCEPNIQSEVHCQCTVLQGWCRKMLFDSLSVSCRLYFFLPSDSSICVSSSKVWILSWILFSLSLFLPPPSPLFPPPSLPLPFSLSHSLCLRILCTPLGHSSHFCKHRKETRGFASSVLVPVFLYRLWVFSTLLDTPSCARSPHQHSWEHPFLTVDGIGASAVAARWPKAPCFPAVPQCFPEHTEPCARGRTLCGWGVHWVWSRESSWKELNNKTVSVVNRIYTNTHTVSLN